MLLAAPTRPRAHAPRRSAGPEGEAYASVIFAELDADNSGELDFDEFYNTFRDLMLGVCINENNAKVRHRMRPERCRRPPERPLCCRATGAPCPSR